MEEQQSAIGCLPKYKNGHLNIFERDASMRLDMKKSFCLWSIFAVTGALVGGGCVEKVYVQQPAPAATAEPPPSGPQVPPPSLGPGEGMVEPSAPQPAPQADVVVAAPGPGYIWTAGYYDWNGVAWVWLPGRWARPPRPGAFWIGGHWDHRYGRRVWVRGRWR
jgi:hypothetical protein